MDGPRVWVREKASYRDAPAPCPIICYNLLIGNIEKTLMLIVNASDNPLEWLYEWLESVAVFVNKQIHFWSGGGERVTSQWVGEGRGGGEKMGRCRIMLRGNLCIFFEMCYIIGGCIVISYRRPSYYGVAQMLWTPVDANECVSLKPVDAADDRACLLDTPDVRYYTRPWCVFKSCRRPWRRDVIGRIHKWWLSIRPSVCFWDLLTSHPRIAFEI